ncbi:MAG: CopD family protein [Flavobacteriales bacterium]|jgi:putative membrane protein|tara:strand:+ start:3842 stop:4423 length:582 start_codon:yes stop_codon:yes gene_type:complete
MEYNYLKALHIIFVVTWFAGLFYIVRLFIYFVEANDEDENAKAILQKQYKLMSKRLWYGITWPSAVLTAFFASWLLFFTPEGRVWLVMPWMHIKLTFVVALYVYHFMCQRMFMQLMNDKLTFSSFKLRMWNEVATIILFAVVFLVTLKSAISWVWGVVGIILFGVLLMLAIRAYKKLREKKEVEQSTTTKSEE